MALGTTPPLPTERFAVERLLVGSEGGGGCDSVFSGAMQGGGVNAMDEGALRK